MSAVWMGIYRYQYCPHFETYLQTGFTKFVASEDDMLELFKNLTFKPDTIKKACRYNIKDLTVYAYPTLEKIEIDSLKECNYVHTFVYEDLGFGKAKGIITFSKEEVKKTDLDQKLSDRNSNYKDFKKEATSLLTYDIGTTYTDYQLNNFTIAFKSPSI
jgi:hypothetical protein